MTDLNLSPASPRASSLVANALNMQAIGGSMAIIYAAYMKRHGMTVEQDEFQAYSTLFTEGLTVLSLLIHFIVVRVFMKGS